jgi:hypothetical protein
MQRHATRGQSTAHPAAAPVTPPRLAPTPRHGLHGCEGTQASRRAGDTATATSTGSPADARPDGMVRW